MLGQLMQQIMKSGEGTGGGSGSSGAPSISGTGTTCTTYTPTSDPTQVGANPCVYYVPSATAGVGNTTGSGSSASDLLNALGGSTGTGVAGAPVGTATGGPAGTTQGGDNTQNPAPALSQQVLTEIGALGLTASSAPQKGQSFPSVPGVVGNILFNNGGATIYASTINAANNSAMSGFYGSDNPGMQPQGVVASMCQTRPWASNFLSNFIPSTFFDSLCQWGGYQVGQPPAPAQTTPQVSLSQQRVSPQQHQATTTAATSTTPSVPPQVQIWAVPATVNLGARTSIFWKTQGVTNCTETSPDGSFSQDTLQGAGATVPITAATTYTISCVDPSGNPVTSYVTVNLSI